MAKKADEDTQTSLEKIKKRLSSASSSCLMEGTLLKRSETLRKWNQRWITLDPTTGKMEYRVQQGDTSPRGFIFFEPESTITLSPINFHGAGKYDGCCFYIGTPQKKEYYLCAESPTVARAWVSTLRAAALVLKAHREAVDSLSGNGHAKLGTVAAVVAAANATAREGMKEMQQSLKSSLKPAPPPRGGDVSGDDASTVMKETLRVKDEELNQVARDLRARDYMIKEMADRLSETAEAAEAAASAARAMEKERKQAQAELEDLKKEFDERLYHAACEVRAGDERLAAALKAREIALQEAQRWRVELGKGREQIVMMEGAVLRAEDNARRALADAEERVKAAKASETVLVGAKDEAVDQARQWQARADYYQGQAARYLGLLQQQAVGLGNAGAGCQQETVQSPIRDESATEGPAIQIEDKAATEGLAIHNADKSLTEEPAVQGEDKSLTEDPATQEEFASMTDSGHPEAQASNANPPEERAGNERSREGQMPTPAGDPGHDFSRTRSSGDGSARAGGHPGRGLGKDLNYITAVDFEQLQVDTYHIERPPSPKEAVSETPVGGVSDSHTFPPKECQPLSPAIPPVVAPPVHEDAGGSTETSNAEK